MQAVPAHISVEFVAIVSGVLGNTVLNCKIDIRITILIVLCHITDIDGPEVFVSCGIIVTVGSNGCDLLCNLRPGVST